MSNPNDANCNGDCNGCSDCDTGFNQHDATVTLTLDDDTEVECAVVTIYPAGDKEYIALLPLNEKGENEDGEVYLYRYSENDGQPVLENIEADAEYEVAAEAFDELLDKAEFDELVEGEDL